MSMTGFGRGAFEVAGRHFRIEIRSLNSRFLDVKVSLPWVDGEIENRLRVALKRGLGRGRVDLTLVAASGGETSAAGQLTLNEPLARDLGVVLRRLAELVECDAETAVRLLPAQRDLLTSRPGDSEAVWAAMKSAFDLALHELVRMREREGEALCADLSARACELVRLSAELRAITSGEPAAIKTVLERRLAALTSAGLEPQRLAQEVAHLADRSDVSEEQTRIRSHLEQLEGMLSADGEIGRKLEFMLQELHREFNTVAAKSGDARVAPLVVEAKAHLEKMREQAQNVE